jgi:hypothetical protein
MGWEQLLNIRDQARAEHDAEMNTPPVACPNDGEPLQSGPGGVLFCPFDGWQYPRDAL